MEEAKYPSPFRSSPPEERKLLVAVCIQIATTEALKNHVYEKEGDIYYQVGDDIISWDLMWMTAWIYQVWYTMFQDP